MDKLTHNTLLEYNVNQLEEVRSTYGYKDVNKLEQAIDIFEKWIMKEDHFVVKKYDRNYLERFIIANKGEVERAKRRLNNLCLSRNLQPEYLIKIKMEDEIKLNNQIAYFCILPKPTPSHRRILYYEVKQEPVNVDFNMISACRNCFGIIQYLLCNDYNVGIDFIYDTRNINFALITKLSPIVTQKGLTILTECFGARLNSVHMISGSKFFQTVLSVIKQSMSDKLKKRIQVHSSHDSLHEFFPKEILPKDLGGSERSLDEITELNTKVLTAEEHTKQMNFDDDCITDESKRIECKFNEEYLGMPGSFKVLCID